MEHLSVRITAPQEKSSVGLTKHPHNSQMLRGSKSPLYTGLKLGRRPAVRTKSGSVPSATVRFPPPVRCPGTDGLFTLSERPLHAPFVESRSHAVKP
ncbi:hypothetical protein ACOMHN_059020 [Nucella lapillus]